MSHHKKLHGLVPIEVPTTKTAVVGEFLHKVAKQPVGSFFEFQGDAAMCGILRSKAHAYGRSLGKKFSIRKVGDKLAVGVKSAS